MGASKGSEAHENYLAANNQPTMDYYYDDVKAARTMLAAGLVMAGLGVAALGVSIYSFVSRPAAREEKERVEVVPTVGGVSVVGRF